jgi:hypothetical protein
MNEILHEELSWLYETSHLGKLLTDQLVFEKGFSECFAFESVFVAVLQGNSAESERCDSDPQTLVREG